jgi:predicted ATPase
LLNDLSADTYAAALADHRRVIREACIANGGVEVDTQGDAFFFAFATAPGALAAASEFTERLATNGRIRVRVGVHTGAPLLGEEGYVGHDVHRAARIAAAGHGGQVLVSAATAKLVDAELTDLGEHRLKDLEAAERVYQLGGGAFPPLKSLYRVNLPIPATSFFGRERELRSVTELIGRADTRVVTLTGPGGTGKTRLALEAASRAADAFPDGTHWVGLASLRDQEHVLPAIAQALEIGGANDLEAIASALSGKRRLIVLDNCEHLLPELASTIASLRDSTDTLTILATSRERLQLSGEQTYAVPGLSKTEGPQLFAARAEAVGAAPTSMPAVVELCERLDELPLAIELAAARSVALSPEQLLERLGQRLDLLKGARDADPRQVTLRATIQWSHDLLDASERRLFRELSVFRGGCTLDAAETICGADLETLQSLLDKSLVRWRESVDDSRRYWMLETIREFAHEELERAGDRGRLRDAHARWYAGATERRAGEIRREDRAAFAWVASEIDNLRAALATLIEQQASEEAVVLAASVAKYFPFSGAYREYLDVLARIESLAPLPSRELARLQRGAAEAAHVLGDDERWVAILAAAAATAEAAGDDIERWKTALARGAALHGQGNTEEGRPLMELAVARLREVASGQTLASALYTYGRALAGGGEPERAVAMFGEALEISRHEGLDYGVAISTMGLAWAQSLLGNHPDSLGMSAASAAKFADLGDREGVALSLGNAAETLVKLDDRDLAATLWAVSMRTLSELGLTSGSAGSEGAMRRDLLEESLGPTRLAELAAAAGALGDHDAIRLATDAAARFGSGSPSATLNARG